MAKTTLKYFYFVITCRKGPERYEGTAPRGTSKFYSWAAKIPENNDVLGYANRGTGDSILHGIQACKSFKEAKELAHFWNECYKTNHEYIFDETF